jgi:uroporphyrinogen decarboxylase
VTSRFLQAIRLEATRIPPVWLMRQAGRYHAPYQKLRAEHSFEALCRTPELAAEVAMAPIRDFDFDAAILFSDLLFPLEALGFGLSYADGPPKLDGRLTPERIATLRPHDDALASLTFQRDALSATRAVLPLAKGLIGFVGGPWTLFVYAVEGTHSGTVDIARAAFDLYHAFATRLVPLLVENIRLQFEGGADVVMVFDTAAGQLRPEVFGAEVAADLGTIANAFPGRLGYYAKGLRSGHLIRGKLADQPWAGYGLDPHWNLAQALTTPRTGFVQGNFDPQLLLQKGSALRLDIRRFLEPLRLLDVDARRGWICGLGHGVLPNTPEESVRTFVQMVRETFA